MPQTTLREDATAIFLAGVRAADPRDAVLRHLQVREDALRVGPSSFHLADTERIWLVGMGKASAAMASPILELLGPRVSGGVILVKEGHGIPLPGIQVVEAGHPVPDQAGVRGMEKMVRLLEATGPRDLVICLISGGGSALSPSPVPGVTLDDKRMVTELLLASGARIHEINAVRKHLSRIKGGQLARLAHPTPLVSLILSDVVGDDLDTIASGPTVADGSTFSQALKILEQRGLMNRIPPSVVEYLRAGEDGEHPETVKAGDPALAGTVNVVVGSNALALSAAAEEAQARGYAVSVAPGFEEGEARELARSLVEGVRKGRFRRDDNGGPSCTLTGGEATVTLRGDGEGGRNQEFALAAATALEGMEGILVLSGGTDGTDGPTDAAGAVADGSTVARGRELGMEAEEFLSRNDSYNFFDPLGDLLRTGPTLTNVMDLRIVLQSAP